MPEISRSCANPGCGEQAVRLGELQTDRRETIPGEVPRVAARLTAAERWSALKVRWGIGRTRYRVRPGLYAVGDPDASSVVLVSANYRLSFDLLRKELGGLNAWVLVLDTGGINVWCAAGKGTFGTSEIVRRVGMTALRERVSHRTLILPQLGAPGVSAHKVKQQTGFNVVYGPVRARDIKQFLINGMEATREMRQATFALRERLAVVPAELVAALKLALAIGLLLALRDVIAGDFSVTRLLLEGTPLLGALLAGTAVVPALLPWIPFRSFALKGWVVGIVWAFGISLLQSAGPVRMAGDLLLLPALSAYMALNYTGSTTFTSQSGVNKEIRMFARPMALSALAGILVLIGRSLW